MYLNGPQTDIDINMTINILSTSDAIIVFSGKLITTPFKDDSLANLFKVQRCLCLTDCSQSFVILIKPQKP